MPVRLSIKKHHPAPALGATPICRAKRGGLKDTDPTDLLAVVLKV